MPETRITLLGGFAVAVDGQEIPAERWKRRRAVELLSLLALAAGRALHREEAIDRLWPDKDLEAGANNLYRALHDLRAIVGHELATLDKGVVRLAAEAWVDVDAFEQAASGEDERSLADALALYRGELLPEDPYGEALLARREGLRQRFVDAALRLSRLCERDADRQIAVLRRLLEVDPAQERGHRGLMAALARAGRPADALRQFAECTKALRERLDTEPNGETLALAQRIERGEIMPASEVKPHADAFGHVARRLLGTDAPRPPRGRSGELAAIARFVARGSGSLLLIGEAGVGKTRLAVEAARLAAARGATVLAGVGYDFEGTAPYTPFVDAWADWLRLAGASAALLSGRHLTGAEQNPFLAFRPVPGASAQEDRLRLFQRVEQAIAALAVTAPVYLLLEDLHHADESSLQLFHYLARACGQLPLWLVATVREEELRVGAPLHALLTALKRERLGERMQLERLDLATVTEIVSDALGKEAAPAVAQRVHALSAGNPFYAEEVARALADEASSWISDDLLANVRERVVRLGADAEQLLVAAAVIGQRFPFETALAASALAEPCALAALEAGLAARVIEEDDEGYHFRHALVREALYRALTRARRVHLHRTIAAIYERRPDADAHAELLVHHHDGAGQSERALPHLLCAASRARERLGFGEAVAFLERAQAILRESGAPPGPRELDILLSLGGMRVALGDLAAAVRDLDRAAALSHDAWRPSRAERARALRLGALALIEGGDLAAAEQRLEESLREVENERGSDLASVLYHFSQLRWHQSRHRDAYALAERCLSVAEACNDPQAVARGYEMLALACHSLGEWREGMQYEEKRQSLADGALDVASAFDVHL